MNIPINQIIQFTKTTPGLVGSFKYTDNNKIRLGGQKAVDRMGRRWAADLKVSKRANLCNSPHLSFTYSI